MSEMHPIMERLHQTATLLRKNALLARRSSRSTAAQVLVPIFFVAFLFVLQQALSANQRRGDFIRYIPDSTVTELEEFDVCYAPLSGEDEASLCGGLGFTSVDDPNTVDIIQRLAVRGGSDEDGPLPIVGFRTTSEANFYLEANPRTLRGLVHIEFDYGCSQLDVGEQDCYASNHSLSEVQGISYHIQYNQSVVFTLGVANNPTAEVLLPLQRLVDQTILETFGEERGVELVDYAYRLRKYPHPELITTDVIRTAGPPFFFAALCFNLVIQVGAIAREKEFHLRESMRVMGLYTSSYWVSWTITNIIFNTISVASLIVAALIFQFDFFLKNAAGLYIVHFWLFGMSLVPLAMVLSTFVSKAATANSLGFGVFIFGALVQSFASLIFDEDTDVGYRILFSFIPMSLFSAGLTTLSQAADNELDAGLTWAERSDGFFSLTDMWSWLIIDTIIFYILLWYLDAVIGDEQAPWFFLTREYWVGGGFVPWDSGVNLADDDDSANGTELTERDTDVRQEEAAIAAGTIPADEGLTIQDLRKVYTARKAFVLPDPLRAFCAVGPPGHRVSFHVAPNTCLALLGHNGAGKSTTVGILTGLLKATSGTIKINGHSVATDMASIRRFLGYCPQHDVLFNELTAKEHIELYGAFNQLTKEQIEQEVVDRLTEVNLYSVKDVPVGSFSGGMRRRCSIAVAFVGNKSFVILDEPSTGVDVFQQRSIWNLIQEKKKGRMILLVTHSMQEADLLGDKIVIMKHGFVVSLGTSLRLKAKYGSGYQVTIVAKDSSVIEELVTAEGWTLEEASGDNLVRFTASPEDSATKLPAFFRVLEERRKELHIRDVQLALTSLEAVFLKVASDNTEDERSKVDTDEATGKGRRKWTPLRIAAAVGAGCVAFLILLFIIFALAGRRSTDEEVKPVAPWPRAAVPTFVSPTTEPLDKLAFPFATTVGDVTEDSAVVLLRAAPSTLSAGSHLHLHMYDEESEAWILDEDHSAGPGSDDLVETTDGVTLRVELTDLQPDTSYALFLVRADTQVRSETASFRTPPSASSKPDGRRIVFGASSCSGPRNGRWPSLARAAEANLDFFIFAGDTVYADGSSTVEDFRAHWDSALAVPALVNLTRSTPLIVTVDDHEFRNDFAADTIDPSLFTAGLTAFRQAMPHAYNSRSTAGIYRRISWGPSLDVFVLDTRTERNISANMYISEDQMAWLLNGLAESTAAHKVIVNSVPITDMASLYGSGGISDRWSGFPGQRAQLISFMEERNISAFFVSGDFHFGALTHVGANFGAPAYGMYEAFTGPSGSDINPIVKTALATTASSQYLRLHDTWTYTRFDLDTEADTLLVSFIDDYGVTISEDLLRPLEPPEPPSEGAAPALQRAADPAALAAALGSLALLLALP